jgi:hypothetical protein
MNKIVGFGLCKLSDKELMEKVDKHVDDIYRTGRIPSRHIPARPDEDFDLLIGELIMRYYAVVYNKSKETADE